MLNREEEKYNLKEGPSVSLDSCFQSSAKEELLIGDDQWYCNNCKNHQDAYKKLELFKPPKIFMI